MGPLLLTLERLFRSFEHAGEFSSLTVSTCQVKEALTDQRIGRVMLALTRRADTAPQMESENPEDKVFTGREVISRDDSHVSSTEIQSIKPRTFTETRPSGPSETPSLKWFCRLSLRRTTLNCRASLSATCRRQKQSMSCPLHNRVESGEHPSPAPGLR